MSHLEITTWPHEREPQGDRAGVDSWHTLAVLLAQSANQAHDARAWAPVTFTDDRRALANVEAVYAVGVDVDEAGDPHRVAAALEGLRAIVHTTRSHTPKAPRCRAVVQIAEPTDAAGHRRALLVLEGRLAGAGVAIDPAARDAARLWFRPSRPADGSRPVMLELDGEPLVVPPAVAEVPDVVTPPAPVVRWESRDSAHRAVNAAARWLAQCEPSVSGQRGHCRAYLAARSLLHRFALPDDVALDLLRQWNRACVPPWSERDLVRKVEEARNARVVPERAEVLRHG